MRSATLFTAAFAAVAAATPLRRDVDVVVETDTAVDVTYVTDIVTVTAGEATAAPATTTATTQAHWGHHSWHVPSSVVSVASVETSTVAPAPASSVAASSSVVVPAPSSAAPAPSSSAAATSYAPSPASSSVASTVAGGSSPIASTYQQAVIDHHNYHRANHSASALTWNSTLADIAMSIAQTCVYAHNTTAGGGGYGQNIAAGVDNNNISAVITDLFYNGEVNYFNGLYGQENPDMTNFEKWGHFSQIVWKGTEQVGCATNKCSSLANTDGTYVQPYFTVCNYGPPGNYAGEYGTNIGNSLNQASVEWNYNVASSFD